MAIPETLHKWRYHLLTAAIAVAAAVGIPRIFPSFQTILGFFAPLLISTALVLWTVPTIARYTRRPPEVAAGMIGRDILDFVAGGHEELPLMSEEIVPLLEDGPPPVEETPAQPPLLPVNETPPPPPDEAAKHPKSL